MSTEPIAGWCDRCGEPFGAAAGTVCVHCGTPIAPAPPVSRGYSYPVLPASAVPGSRGRLGHRRLLLFAAGGLVAMVSIITAVAVVSAPAVHPCGFYCGPHTGPRLLSPTAYHSSTWGYAVPFDAHVFQVVSQDASGVELETQGQTAGGGTITGEVEFTAASGSDLERANQDALAALPSSRLTDIQPTGAVRGAEIGFVAGEGTAYSAEWVRGSGSGAVPYAVVIFSATHAGITITVTAFGSRDTSVSDAPYGLTAGTTLDYPVSGTLWKGQS